MAPHEVGLAFELDTRDIEAGIRKADRLLAPRLLEVLNTMGGAIARRARIEHRYKNRTGKLTGSIHSLPAQALGDGAEVEVIADAPHAAPIHYGSKPHIIEARNGRALRFIAGGQVVFRRSVRHPGTAPDAFLEDALLTEMNDATDLTARYAHDVFREAGF